MAAGRAIYGTAFAGGCLTRRIGKRVLRPGSVLFPHQMEQMEPGDGIQWCAVAERRNPFVLRWGGPVIAATIVVLAGGFVWLVSPPYRHGTSLRFVGPEACQDCHEEQYESWSRTRMARSFEVLLPGFNVEEKESAGLDPEADFSRDEACVPCHTTGYGLMGGFVSIEETPEMAGVTCEACHGPGGRYAETVMSKERPEFKTADARSAGLVYPPTARVCTGCHNEDSPFIGMDYVFDLEKRVAIGTHEHLELKYEHE